ncbi:MAG: SPOR domain-containing protein [Muribaculaceae bacterium]|nr:SPOR domain-containing protein [Muribaculaceae bacterium]
MSKFSLFSLIFLVAGVSSGVAQDPVAKDSVRGDSSITVIQPEELRKLLEYKKTYTIESVADDDSETAETPNIPGKAAGYRVQVFSDNNQRTAKGEARTKEKMLKEAFPEFGTYIVFNSPFWRLKVGDFRTQHEANAAADAIKSRFPAFSREVRVVHDRINTNR